jgi:hypothetical protein
MSPLTRRVCRLEDQFGADDATSKGILIVASRVGLALKADACVQILRECGFLPTGPGFGLVNLIQIPDGLNSVETERFLREKGREICGTDNAQNHGGPADARQVGAQE